MTEIYLLKVDYKGTRFSVPEPIGVSVTSKKEADDFVKQSTQGERRSYEKVSVFETVKEIEEYQNTLRDAEVIVMEASRKGSSDKSGLYKNRSTGRYRNTPANGHKMCHIYLISNDEICDGDPVYDAIGGKIFTWDSQEQQTISPTGCKKIVAATDQRLNLPVVGDQFTDEFIVSGASIRYVTYKVIKQTAGYKGLIDVAVVYTKER